MWLFFFFFLKLNASLHYNQRDGSFSKYTLVSFLLFGILQRAPHLLRACHGCIMAYEGSQPSISRPCGFGLISSTYQVLSKEAFASATPFTTIKGVDKSKKKKLPDSTLTCYVTSWSCLAFYFFRFFYLRWRICINDPQTLSVFKLWISQQSFW